MASPSHGRDARGLRSGKEAGELTLVSRFWWCPTFSDARFEQAFCADAFRRAFTFHLFCYSSLAIVLCIGLADPAFGHIASVLFPLALVEAALRVALHQMSDHSLAQQQGALLMIALTSFAWIAYVCAAVGARREGLQIAGALITGTLPLMLLIYPAQLCCFFLSPGQKEI